MGVLEKAKQIETREAFLEYKGKKRTYPKAKYADMEEYILSDECARDLERLEKGDYFLDYPLYCLIPKNFQKRKRAIYRLPDRQNFLMSLIVFSLSGDIESHYSDRLFSFRSDRTGAGLLNEICGNKDIKNMYVLKTDISDYVGSIVPELLVPMLEDVFMPDDPSFFRFLEWLVTRGRVVDHSGNVIDHCPGGMGGVPVGNIFMNLYLHEVDDWFAPRAAFYSRYSDDILICAHTYEEMQRFEKELYDILGRLRLTVNREKTGILMPGEAFDLLGMELSRGGVSLSEHSISKIKRRIRMNTNRALLKRNRGLMTPEEAAREFLITINRFFFGVEFSGSLMSWARWSFPVITDTKCLEELDHYIQDSLRYILYGSMKKRKMTIPYEKLSQLGYRSIVYIFRTNYSFSVASYCYVSN